MIKSSEKKFTPLDGDTLLGSEFTRRDQELLTKNGEIERIDNPNENLFYEHYVRRNKPVVVTGVMSRWPATSRWSFDFFRRIGHDKTVMLEVGNVMQNSTKFYVTQFGDYLNDIERSTTKDQSLASPRAYLSVFEMFALFPELEHDVDFSLLAKRKLLNSKCGWFGPAGTVTGYHIDWADNLLAQIQGRKVVHLVSPAQSENMYPGSKFDFFSTLSQVDKDMKDLDLFPRFAQVRPLQTLLSPGEMLFIPRGWWHHVRSLDASISVNNFGMTLGAILTDGVREVCKYMLHGMGLYGKDCTCHRIVNGRRVRK